MGAAGWSCGSLPFYNSALNRYLSYETLRRHYSYDRRLLTRSRHSTCVRRTGPVAPIVVAGCSGQTHQSASPTRFDRPSTTSTVHTDPLAPAGVVLSHKRMHHQLRTANVRLHRGFGKGSVNSVSWLPFYHDMGLMLGIILPMIEIEHRGVDESHNFLQRPTRWMQLLAKHRAQVSAPNFGFELAVRRTSDDDMAE